jgi:carboxyl-terminal processing protease
MENKQPDSNKNKQFKDIFSNLFPKIIFVVLVFAFGVWIGQNVTLPFGNQNGPLFRISNKNTPKEIQVDFAPFWDVWERVTAGYLDRTKLDPKKLLYGAISGMVGAVGDPYTVFLDPTENEDFNTSLSGTYEGIGIELGASNGAIVVIAPIDGTPASKAGVEAGDKILGIDGVDASTMTLQDAVSKIRGKEGTNITLKLERDGKSFEVTITRAKIVIKSVEFKDLGSGIGRVKILRFGDNTLSEWNDAVGKVVSGGYKKIILDLRNDPGGRLDYAIDIAGDFVSRGKVVMLQEEASGKRTPFSSDNEGRLQDVQVVVLINKGSASASEIVAGALRDTRGVKLVGETSFGKGTIQKVDSLSDGSGLHITFAKWLTPSGFWVNGKGLKPDIEIKLTDDDKSAGRDPQLDKAKELLR